MVAGLLFHFQAHGQLKDLKSDPTFNETSKEQIEEDTEVSVNKGNQTLPEETISEDKVPKRVIVAPTSTPENFSVKTSRIGGPAKKSPPRPISLISPAHNSVYTTGVITFSWKINTSKKSKKNIVVLKIERLDGKKKFSKRTRREKKLLDLSPGEYRWQVSGDKKGQESKWRHFRVQDTKTGNVSRNRKDMKKNTPLPVALFIKELDNDDEGDLNEPSEVVEDKDQKPLEIPESLRRIPATTD